ncbi:AAA family ATPase [Hansschlegelia sp. KR7-227]|uniref:bifunctional aminoglycoside phosphotransferase/ATP-binding protein n=1 Tax=Hansschlegelia sp. KR7-227 TaxID=3400914 RepID=UPI003BFD2037
MSGVDQHETIAFLNSDAAFPGAAQAELIETHISLVFLSGPRAIKLKRAVRLDYVDFSTPERRLAACERELALNRRTAPALYRAVHRITRRADGGLTLNGDGPLVDAVVEMVRFDQDGLLERLALRNELTKPMLTRLANRIAAFHASAEIDPSPQGALRMATVLEGNERAFAATAVFPPEAAARLAGAFRARLEALSPLLDLRARAGKVRRCHGDLHLRNICLVDGEPTLFDCLEFDETLATTDVLYDVAFLLMDLWRRGRRAEANLVFNRYLDASDEEDGLPLVAFLMAVRAAVRAHVAAAQGVGGGDAAPASLQEAHAYFGLAQALLEPVPARLVAVGGLSGSGKSTVAAALAPDLGPAPGARILATDRIRKQLFGVSAETRLPQAAYRPDVSRRVYAQLGLRAERILRLGHAVVADAVFDRPDERSRIADAAAGAGTAFTGVWLDADPDLLMGRVRARTGDVSDATADVVAQQLTRSIGTITWTRARAAAGADAVCSRVLSAIEAGAPAGAARPEPDGSQDRDA